MFKTLITDIISKKMKKKLNQQTVKEDDISEVLKEIKINLLDADVNIKVVNNFISSIKKEAIGKTIDESEDPQKYMLKIIKQELIKILGQQQKTIDINSKNNCKIMLVGLQGSGKTTTAAKIANYFKNKNKKVPLLVGLDIYRPAAIEQLKVLAEQINVNFYDESTNDPSNTADHALDIAKKQNNNLIIFDTAGRLQTDKKLMDELISIKKTTNPDEIILVIDALVGQEIINVAHEFHDKLKLTGIIITKFDSDARAGAALSLTSLLNVPIKFLGTGEKIGSLELFHPERIANRILNLGDIMTLAEKANEVIDEKKAMKSFQKMLAGKMDLEDLLIQLESVNKMGSLSGIMKMMPNMNISSNKIEETENKIYVWKILLSSMTVEERKNPKLILRDPNRKIRIIKGSGRKPDELNKLMKSWETSRKQMEAMGKMIKSGGNPFQGFM